MKKFVGLFMCLAILAWCAPAFAIPALQLDISEGYYNEVGDPFYNPNYDNETIVALKGMSSPCMP